MNRELGLVLVAVGVLVVLAGVVVWTGGLSWFGRLPGDLRWSGERSRVFVPITSAIIASVVLTIVVNVLLRWFR